MKKILLAAGTFKMKCNYGTWRKQDVENKIRKSDLFMKNIREMRVRDASGDCGDFFTVLIVSDVFESVLSDVQRHRMVHQALGKESLKEIHALRLLTFSPSEWETEKHKFVNKLDKEDVDL